MQVRRVRLEWNPVLTVGCNTTPAFRVLYLQNASICEDNLTVLLMRGWAYAGPEK